MSESNSPDTTTTDVLPGGSVRVSFGVPAEAPTPSAPPTTRVVDGGYRLHADGTAEHIGGVTRYTVNRDGEAGGSIMATRQRINGQDTVLMNPGDAGSRVQLRFALQEGLIREIAQGVYTDATAADGSQRTCATVQAEQQQAQQQREQQAQYQWAADTAGIFDSDEDAEFAAEFATVPDHVFRSAMASMVREATVGQGDFSRAAATLARDAGVSQQQAAEMIGVAHEAQDRIITRALAKVGISQDMKAAAYSAFREEPGKLTNALHHLMHARNVEPFQAMGREWLAKSQRQSARGSNSAGSGSDAGNEAFLQQAGFQTGRTADGTLMVRRGDSGWVAASELLKG